MTNGKQELQETLDEWNGLFTRHGLELSLEKTEWLHIGHQRQELDIELERKKLTHGDSFVDMGGVVCGDGKTERESRRVQERSRGGGGGLADLKKTKGHEHFYDTGMPVRS